MMRDSSAARKTAFWKELDDLGADEVRSRLARKIYGHRKAALANEWLRRFDAAKSDIALEAGPTDVAANRQMTGHSVREAKLANWLSAAALLLALSSFLLSWASYREAHHEPLLLHATRSSDSATVLEPSPFPPPGSADMITYWDILLVNNGQQAVSVLTLNIRLLTPNGEVFYSGLVDAILDAQLRSTTPPWTLDPGKPIKLVARIRLHVAPAAYVYLHEAFPDGHIPSIQRAQMMLADHKLDFWGDSIGPIRDDSRTVGFTVKSMTQQRTINFSMVTGRGTVVSDVASWYPSFEQ